MSNSANQPPCFFLDAPQTEVVIEGQPAPRVRLDSLETSLGGAPRAHFSVGLGRQPGTDEDFRLREAQLSVRPGQSVTARLVSGGTLPGAPGPGLVLFEGRVVRLAADLTGDGESFRFEAEDPVADVLRRRVSGQRLRTAAGDDDVVDGLALVFNPEGRPNAAYEPHQPEEGDPYTIFAPAGTPTAVAWTLGQAVTYVLSEFAQTDGLSLPTGDEVANVVGDLAVCDVSLEGQTLGQALDALLELVGARTLVSVEPGEAGVTRRLSLWSRSQAPMAWLTHQVVGAEFTPTSTNIAALAVAIHLECAPRRYVARGDRKIYESTFDLVAAWDATLESYDPDDFSPGANANFAAGRDVFRKWVLNEDGRYTADPYNRGDPPDLSTLFEGAKYVRRPRRLLPCLSRDALGRSHGVYAEISLDGGQSWQRLTLAARVLTDECGLYFTEDLLPDRYLAAVMRHQVRVRVTAAIEADAYLKFERPDDGTDDLPGRARHIAVPAGYRYRRVAETSRFYGSPSPDEVDDSERLQALLDAAYEADRSVPVTGCLRVPWLALEHSIGESVWSIAWRNVQIALDEFGYRARPVVRRVCHTLAPTVQTELELE